MSWLALRTYLENHKEDDSPEKTGVKVNSLTVPSKRSARSDGLIPTDENHHAFGVSSLPRAPGDGPCLDSEEETHQAFASTHDESTNDGSPLNLSNTHGFKGSKAEYLEQMQEKTKISAAEAKKKQKIAATPWTQKSRFQTVVGFVIGVNAITLGLEVDRAEEWKEVFFVFEHLFTFVFVVEMLTRWKVEGMPAYFKEPASCLDFALVMLSVVDVWILSPMGGEAGLRSLSLLRLLRLARLTRLLRLFKVFKELTIIATSFVTSGKTLFWGGIFLWVVTYMFAIFATQRFGRASTCENDGRLLRSRGGTESSADECDVYTFEEDIGTQYSLFGTLDRSMLTLYICLSEGCGIDIIYPMTKKNPVMFLFWYVFVFITSFGIMNVMVGLFCENVMEGALENEKNFSKMHEEDRIRRLELLQDLFAAIDTDGSDTITRSEYTQAVHEDKNVIETLEFLELDQDVDLFDMLDVDESGELTFQEFFHGCMLMMNANQPAKGKDSIATYLISQSTHKMMQSVLGTFDDLKKRAHAGVGRPSMPEQIDSLSDRQCLLERDVKSLHTKIDTLAESLESKMDDLAKTLATLVASKKGSQSSVCLLPWQTARQLD